MFCCTRQGMVDRNNLSGNFFSCCHSLGWYFFAHFQRSMGITEEDLRRMPPEQRSAIEDIYKKYRPYGFKVNSQTWDQWE